MARFREADEATSVADRRGSILDIIRGQRLGSLPGGFLVNFLCKENWNIGAREALSKEGLLRLSLPCTKEETISDGEVFSLVPRSLPCLTAKRVRCRSRANTCARGEVSLAGGYGASTARTLVRSAPSKAHPYNERWRFALNDYPKRCRFTQI